MGLLDAAGAAISNSDFAAPFRSIFGSVPEYVGADFDSFDIQEITAGGETENGVLIQFAGEWMPRQPFQYGGKQRLIKEYYPGNAEPTVQVLGSQETELKITGRFKVKKLSGDPDTLRPVPSLLCEALDSMRKRGNLVKLSMGEWARYGFIEETVWKMKTLADIEYEISFFIVGETLPSQCKLNDEGLDLPLDENLNLITQAMTMEALTAPLDSVDQNLFQELNGLIGDVATALSVVTKFVDGVISAAENAQALANRAIGLIKYAQSTIATFKRRVGALNAFPGRTAFSTTWNEAKDSATAKYMMQVQMATMKPPQPSAAQLAASKAKASAYTPNAATQQTATAAASSSSKSIDAILQTMLIKFQAIANSIPIARYLVKAGDTLQQISTRYYKTPDNWKKIYDHNQLTTTVLVPGTVLEIPKQ